MKSTLAERAALKDHDIATIDLLVVNLYPFEATVAKPGCTLEDAIEDIDIGGPAMVRSGAKNWKHVGVLTDASQYASVLEELKADGKLTDQTRFALSVAAFNRISQYDGAISTSTNCFEICCAAASSSVQFKAMMPPKADVGSVLKALL